MKQITFDCSLGLEDLDKQLKEAERRVENARKNIEKSRTKQDFYAAEEDDARSKEEEAKYGKKLDAEMEREKQYSYELGDAEAKRNEIAGQIAEKQQQAAQGMSMFAGITQKASGFMDMLQKRVKGLVKRVLIFSVITKLLRSIRTYFSNVIKNNEEANKALGRLKGAFQTLAAPLMQLLIPAITTLVNWLTRVVTTIAQFIGQISGKGLNALKKFAKQASDTASSFASFDTINQLGNNGNNVEAQFDFEELSQEELDGMLVTIGLIASGLLAWKVPTEGLTGMQNFAGWLMLIGGAIITVKNYFDAWANGLNANNLAGIIGGIVIALSGLYLLFGPTKAAIGAIIAGIALIVLGFKDIDENGANLINTLTVIGGILAAGIGIAVLVGGSSAWIPLLIAGIAAVVFALVAVGGEAEELVAGVKQILGGLIKFIKGVFAGDWKSAWEGIKDVFKGIWNTILAIVGGVLNAIIKGINWVIDKINSLSFDIPDWVPIIGGEHVGLNVPHIKEWSVPYLAQGAVIPPNREFMAVLGDQAAGTNIEAPLDTIVAAVQQAVGNPNVNIEFRGSLAQLGRVLQPIVSVETGRKGGNLVKGV